jgi:UDP-glucose 4-epimerase
MRGGNIVASARADSCARILVTGAEGLIGTALKRVLTKTGYEVIELDLCSEAVEFRGDVRDPKALSRALADCSGVVHLAALSRVEWSEREPSTCWSTNVEGTKAVVTAARERGQWVLFASSREVYGKATQLPATEETPLAPMNIYGRSKVAGEQLVAAAGADGLPVGIVRLSNVYGRTTDHVDRVVPAFARAAAYGTPLRVDGAAHTFDFTHVDDVVRGLIGVIEQLGMGESTPPIHFVSEQPTTLHELAKLAVTLARSDSPIVFGPERTYDVARFHGCGERARRILRWEPQVALSDGVERLISDFRAESRNAEVAS